jgi:hypothetical protein
MLGAYAITASCSSKLTRNARLGEIEAEQSAEQLERSRNPDCEDEG